MDEALPVLRPGMRSYTDPPHQQRITGRRAKHDRAMAQRTGSGTVKGLLAISRVIDAVNGFIGRKIAWLILVAVLVAAVNAIIRKVSDHVQLEPTAKLTFEVSDGERPMALYCASAPRLIAGTFEVSLAARPASCKPRDRWLAEEQAKSSCCGPASTSLNCCA